MDTKNTRLTDATHRRLQRMRVRLEIQQKAYREAVRTASRDRLHSQACPIGGLWIMGQSALDGGPCWCGERLSDVDTKAGAS